MMLAHAEYIEADLISEFNFFYEIAEPLLWRKGAIGFGIRPDIAESINTEFHGVPSICWLLRFN
jgi:hypothetical protein